MICRIKGILKEKNKNQVIIEKDDFFYQISIPETIFHQLPETGQNLELVIYHYLKITKNKGLPVLIGFIDQLEREFFEKFITISGVGPKAALRAFDKPIPLIAKAIEEGDSNFLVSLTGIGKQKARQIIAQLQGKVGRFALLKEDIMKREEKTLAQSEITQEASQILKRLQYKSSEIEKMIRQAFLSEANIEKTEDLLNEIYRQRKKNSNHG